METIRTLTTIRTVGTIRTDGTTERTETRRSPRRGPGALLASAGRLAAVHRKAERRSRRGFRGEVLGSLAVMGAFVALAVGARALLAAAAPHPPYPRAALIDSDLDESSAREAADAAPHTWLVDGFNLLHAAVLRGRDRREWWRAPARARVLELVRRLEAPGAEVVVVFDGQREPGEQEPAGEEGPRVVFADSADDWLVAAVRSAPDPSRVAVVTADRQVAERARHRGARVMGPATFARRCAGSGDG